MSFELSPDAPHFAKILGPAIRDSPDMKATIIAIHDGVLLSIPPERIEEYEEAILAMFMESLPQAGNS